MMEIIRKKKLVRQSPRPPSTSDQLLFILMEVLGTQQIIKTIIKLILTKA